MSQFSLEQKVSSSSNVLAQDLAGQSVLLNLQTEEYYALDDIGTKMWQTLIEKDSIQSAIDALQVEYQVEPELLQKDVKNLIKELLANELVEVSNS